MTFIIVTENKNLGIKMLTSLIFKRKVGEGNFGSVSLYEHTKTAEKYAVKKFFSKRFKKNEFFSTAESEKENFNCFIHKMGISVPEAVVEEGKLILPFFTGKEPSFEEVQECLVNIYQKGFVMADPNTNNFMHTKHGLIPIDYGAVFNIEDKKFLNNPLARNFVTNAVIIYGKAFDGIADDLAKKYLSLRKTTAYGYYFESESENEDENNFELGLPENIKPNQNDSSLNQITNNHSITLLSKGTSTFWDDPGKIEKRCNKNQKEIDCCLIA